MHLMLYPCLFVLIITFQSNTWISIIIVVDIADVVGVVDVVVVVVVIIIIIKDAYDIDSITA